MSAKPRPGFPARLDFSHPAARAAKPSAPAKTAPAGLGLDSAAVRARMVRRLAEDGTVNARVLSAFAAVERHGFVDTALVNQAYEDTSLPIGLQQTISKPSVVARMHTLLMQAPALAPLGSGQPAGRVLEIGTGCGYQAALMARLFAEVVSIERLRGLHEKARHNLRGQRLPGLRLVLGDGMLGYPDAAPFGGILSAAGGLEVPEAWIAQLALGGRIVAPVAEGGAGQKLAVIDKTAQGISRHVLEGVHFVPLKSGIA